jgi:AbrB family looped-hinge helix DNA binding protein
MEAIIRKVNKLNRSVSVVIPKEIQQAIQIQPGDDVSFSINEEGEVVLRKAAAPKSTDAELLEEIQQLYAEFADSMSYLKDK